MKSLLGKRKLKFVIKIKKKNMCEKAMILGFTHPEVVKYSQELDLLLNIKGDFKKISSRY